MNLLTDSVLTLAGGGKATLPALFAAMTRGEVSGFPALRPHQRPAWHMFLVQLGALTLWTAGRDRLPDNAADWTADLRKLTPDYPDDAPWQLFVKERDKPAFLQPPDPGGLKWATVETPDALDLLITARNHDLKQTVAKQANVDDWLFALVSLQTSAGYDGRGNCGIARMNGGSSSRPMLGLIQTRAGDLRADPSVWWARDVLNLVFARNAGKRSGVGTVGGPALLWCLNWPEGHQLDLRNLDPWFVEVCRRIRLTVANGVVSAKRSTSKAARIDAKAFNGNVDDPWAPVHKTEGKSLTLGGGDFNYKRLCELMFSGDWEVPLLARPGNDESGDMLLVAEALSRGNSKTEGFKSRTVPVPGKVVPFFSPEKMAPLSKAQLDEIKVFDGALSYSIGLMAAGGNRDGVKRDHYKRAAPASKRFDRTADTLFFPSLWRRVEASSSTDPDAEDTAKTRFLKDLFDAATAELESALLSIPCPAIRRPKAESRARRAFRSRVRREFPDLF
ncbi:MAG: CRISPR-associated protein Cse1 [Gemmatimonadetes bacterium]|nr:CRISPR-associated protein Cse1 [Gemmatimonadota bacterium]